MGTMGTMGTMVLQNTVDKLIKKTNLATVIGTHSWREQFLEAITVSAGASPRHRTGGAPNRGDTQPWGHPSMGDTQPWGTPIMGTPNCGNTQLWGTPIMGTPNRGDRHLGVTSCPTGGTLGSMGTLWGHPMPILPPLVTLRGRCGPFSANGDPLGSPHALSPIQVTLWGQWEPFRVNGDPLGSSHAHSSALGDTLGPMGTLKGQWGLLGVIPCPFFHSW